MKKLFLLVLLTSLNMIGQNNKKSNLETITLGGGCYWCVEAVYENLVGVKSAISGFSGGKTKNPTYYEVASGKTGFVEVVQITYDKTVTNLDEILKVFFTVHDPTTLNRQGNDVGPQYRSVIFYNNEEQKKAALDIIRNLNKSKIYSNHYHQDYYANNKNQPYCRMVIQPKIEKFEKVFKDRLKKKK